MQMNEQLMMLHPLVWGRDDVRDVRALFVRDLQVDAHIGVNHQEQGRSQPLRIHLVVILRPPYPEHDRFADTLDYDRLRGGVLDILAQGHINLLETLGERIVQMCFAHAQVQAVHMQIAKLRAHGDCEVGYEALRRR